MDSRIIIGRERELQALDAAIESCLGSRADGRATTGQGARTILFVSGEPGIGKTRLLEELAARALAAGSVTAWGRTLEVGVTPPFWPWLQILTALSTPEDPAPPLGGLEQSTDPALRLSRFFAVLTFLERRCSSGSLAILLDDLHVTDHSSLQLLDYLLPQLSGRRVLFGLSARDADASPEVTIHLARLQRNAVRLPLGPLDARDVATLVAGRADSQRVFELSGGNPLFVEELLSAQQTSGRLGMPRLSSARAVIQERLQRLSSATREALCAAALLGREFKGGVLAAVLEVSDVSPLLAPAVQLGVLCEVTFDCYRFSHALVAEALTEDLSPPMRAKSHARAAQVLEELAPDEMSAIAHHWLSVGPTAGQVAIEAADRAAQQCMTRLAFEDAALMFARALEGLQLAAPLDVLYRARLLCARAEALQHATQHTEAAKACDQAVVALRDTGLLCVSGGSPRFAGDPRYLEHAELFARVALTRGLEFRFGRTDPILVDLLHGALSLVGDRSKPLRAKLLARLAAAEQPAFDSAVPVARALQAIELSRELGPRDRLEVMHVAIAALVEYAEPERIEELLQEVLELARGLDRRILVHALLRRCFVAVERLDRNGLDTAIETYAAEAEALGLPSWTRNTLMLRAMVAVLEGRFVDARRHTDEWARISASIGDHGAGWLLDVHRSLTHWVQTTPPDPELPVRFANYVPGRAYLAAWFGAQMQSIDVTRAALAEILESKTIDRDKIVMAVAAVVYAGSQELAVRFYAELLPLRGRLAVSGMVGWSVMDLYDRLLLLLATQAHLWNSLDEHAADALRAAARLGSPVWTARVQGDWALALTRRARPGDLASAAELARSARSAAERLGMPGLVAQCDAIQSSLARPWARLDSAATPTAPMKPVTAPGLDDARVRIVREGELWNVRGFGQEILVRASRGMSMLAQIVANPGVPVHVIDLSGSQAVDSGDAGAQLDARARTEYRKRLADLASERDEAQAFQDQGRLERIEEQAEALNRELERAFGLAGRERRAGSASERARSNVQRRISHAIEQIRATSPRLAEHLTACVHTGTLCTYEV